LVPSFLPEGIGLTLYAANAPNFTNEITKQQQSSSLLAEELARLIRFEQAVFGLILRFIP
jgi:hypothetical protein